MLDPGCCLQEVPSCRVGKEGVTVEAGLWQVVSLLLCGAGKVGRPGSGGRVLPKDNLDRLLGAEELCVAP